MNSRIILYLRLIVVTLAWIVCSPMGYHGIRGTHPAFPAFEEFPRLSKLFPNLRNLPTVRPPFSNSSSSFVSPAPIITNVKCGDNITQDAILIKDLKCICNDLYALNLFGPATLDLNGHTISCVNRDAICVELFGTGATIKSSAKQKGIIRSCAAGIGGVGSFSNAVIRDVAITQTIFGLFLVYSNGNQVTNVRAVANALVGIFAVGNHTRVTYSYAGKQRFEGLIFLGDNNKVTTSVFEDSYHGDCLGASPDDFFFPFVISNNTFRNNIVRRCKQSGISCYSKNSIIDSNNVHNTNRTAILSAFGGTKIKNNHIMDSGNDGIGAVDGSGYKIVNNVMFNLERDGIDVQSLTSDSVVKGNQIAHCGREGIEVKSHGHRIANNFIGGCETGIKVDPRGDNNTIKSNRVFESKLVDLCDDRMDCGTNTWKNNFAVTKNTDCIN